MYQGKILKHDPVNPGPDLGPGPELDNNPLYLLSTKNPGGHMVTERERTMFKTRIIKERI